MNNVITHFERIVALAQSLNQSIPQTLDQLCRILGDTLQAEVGIYTLIASGEYQAITVCSEADADHQTTTLDLLNGYYRITIIHTEPFDSGSQTIIQALLEGWIERIRSTRTSMTHQQRLGDQRRMLTSIIDALPEGVMVGLAPDGQLVLANRKAEEIWGHPLLTVPEDGYRAFGLFEKDGTPMSPENTGIATVLRTKEAVLGREIVIQRPDMSRVHILSNTSPIWRENGDLMGAVSVFQDITMWYTQASERDHAIATIAHDLKNPLTTIRGSAEILLRRATSDERDEREIKRIEAIISQSDRMKEYLTFLVDIARIDAGTLAINRQPTDVHGLVQNVVNAINLGMTKPRVNLHLDDVKLPVMMLDPIWIERVLWNLLDNALKYSPLNTPVDMRLTLEAHEWVTAIQDYGMGIDPTEGERIFERFTRSQHVRRDVAGTGLGLYTVRAIAKAHGGTITVESDGLGRGSTFILRLPIT